MDRYSLPIGRLTQCEENPAGGFMTTITFLGERQVIIDPDTARCFRRADGGMPILRPIAAR